MSRTRTDYPSLLQADRIADHFERMASAMEDWTDVEKTEFGTILVHTQDDDGTVRIFEVNVKERIVDELDTDEDENSIDPDARRDMDQER
jgi:hypothetical protein